MESEKYDRLCSKRKALRQQVTITCDKVLSATRDNSTEVVNTTFKVLKSLYQRLESVSEEISNHPQFNMEEMENELVRETIYLEKFAQAEYAAQQFINGSGDNNHNQSNGGNGVNNSNTNISLERLSLPEFDGSALKFIEFWNAFKARVHLNSSLNKIDKFSYLRDKLKGSAARAIEGLNFSDQGYDQAIEILVRRFGRKVPLINCHLNALFVLPNVDDLHDVKALRRLCDTMMSHTRALEALNVDITANSQVLGPLLLSRLPLALRVEWQQRSRGSKEYASIESTDCDIIEVKSLLDFFSLQVEDREGGLQTRSISSNKFVETKGNPMNVVRPKPIATTLHINQNPNLCRVCSSSKHFLPKDCPEYLNAAPQQKRDLVKKARLCFNCLSASHSLNQCHSKFVCRHCSQKHHTTLCWSKTNSSQQSEHNQVTTKPTTSLVCSKPLGGPPVLLQTLIVTAIGEAQTCKIRALLDNCSNQTFITQSLAETLKLPVRAKVPLIINHFHGNTTAESFNVCQVKIQSLCDASSLLLNAYVCPQICLPVQGHRVDFSQMPQYKDLIFSEDYTQSENLDIDILIGADFLPSVVTDRVMRGPRGSPIAVETIFGWTLSGPYTLTNLSSCSQPKSINLHCQVRSENNLPWNPHCLSDLETIGIIPEEESIPWPEPQRVGKRFQVELPWKTEDRPLCNVKQVLPRQKSFARNMSPSKATAYHKYIDELNIHSIIESCDDPPPQSFYLPHHGVWKREKLRVVFDGSFGSPSLNQLLQTGPNLLQHLPVCISSFRFYEFPICADIEKAFLQVLVCPKDRDFIRFIDTDGARVSNFRFCRLPFGLCCSPAMLNSCLEALYKEFLTTNPELVNILRRSMYVDDLVCSLDSCSKLDLFKHQCQELFSSASFYLRGWENAPNRVLGLGYSATSDTLSVDLTPMLKYKDKAQVTRRKLVSCVAQLFDPMGFATPFLLQAKLLVQEAWSLTKTWDDPLPIDLKSKLQKICVEIEQTPQIHVPRWLHMNKDIVLHAFSDASEAAYATCIYLVSGSFSTLVMARNRLSPKRNTLTIPRLELMGAVLSTRIIKLLVTKIPEFSSNVPIYFWTDSTCVLGWLQGDVQSLKPFVKNRVCEIRKVVGCWRYCPGSQNPADICTRKASAHELNQSAEWHHGPNWLPYSKYWPPSIEHPEVNCDRVTTMTAIAHTSVSCPTEVFISKYSKLSKLIAVVAWILRFWKACQRKPHSSTTYLQPEEKKEALGKLLQQSQTENLPDVLMLKQKGNIPQQSPLKPLHPFFDQESGLVYATPRTGEPPKILLSQLSHLSKLLIWDTHYQLFHACTDRVLCELQQTYWLIKGRRLVSAQLKKCVNCQRHTGRSYAQREAFLAPFRATEAPPFHHTGVDYAGPLTISKTKTAFILVFVCATVRAVHLEVTPAMDTMATTQAIRRFIARRGTPSQFYSDNAQSFQKVATTLSLTWNFNPPRAPWWGGWWERLIGTLKRSLRKTLHLSALTFPELCTTMTEIESAINQRPLTYVSESPGDDSASPLRPVDFLQVSAPMAPPWVAQAGQLLGSRWRHQQMVVSHLMSRWKKEYLISLRKWRNLEQPGKFPLPGDIVLVNQGSKRSLWPLAKVVKLLPSKTDGFCRVVEIILKGKLTRRATSLLFPLEAEPPWSGPALRDTSSKLKSVPRDRVEVASEQRQVTRTRAGRIIKTPSKLLGYQL